MSGGVESELHRDLTLILTQLQLQQQHIKLIQDVAFRCAGNQEMLMLLQTSLKGVQCSQLLNQRAFEAGCEYVYVLELQENKYYVGLSANLSQRLYCHFVGEGAVWTRRFSPVKVVEVLLGSKEREKERTLQYMRDKGYENVRGYVWTQIRLDGPPREL